MCYFHLLCFTSPNPLYGLPWWLSGKEATCQCRRRGFHSGLGKSRNGNGNPLQHPSPNEMSDPDTTIASLSRVTQGGEDVMKQVSVVHGSSPVWLFSTPWTEARQASLSFAISRSLVRLRSTESVTPSNHLILCRPLLLPPSVFPSIRVFSNEWALRIRWPKYWSFTISPSNEYSGLISFMIDWFDLPAVQGTLQSLHRWTTVQKASALRRSSFFTSRLSLPSNSHTHT